MKMLKLIYPILLVLLISSCTNEPKQEQTEKAEPKESKETSELSVNGFKVIFKPSTKDVVSARFYIRGGSANLTAENQGIEKLALNTITNGATENLDRTQFATALEKLGSSIDNNCNYDASNISLTCVSQSWDESWKLFTDAILNPSFNEDEFVLEREKLTTTAQRNESDPDNHLRNMAMNFSFENLSYAKNPNGTANTVPNLTLQQTKEHYQSTLTKSQCFLVVVGKMSVADLKEKVKSSFGKLPDGNFQIVAEEPLNITESAVYAEQRSIATNYMRGYMNAPKVGTEDEVPIRLAMSILRDRYFNELRTKRSLTYSPGSFYPSGIVGNPYTAIYVSTIYPNKSAQVMIDEIKKIKTEGFSETELKDKKAGFVTRNLMGLETNSSQTNLLGRGELVGDWKASDKFTSQVENVTIDQLNKSFDKYTQAIKWVYLGDKAKVDASILKQPLVEVAETKVVNKKKKKQPNDKKKKEPNNKKNNNKKTSI